MDGWMDLDTCEVLHCWGNAMAMVWRNEVRRRWPSWLARTSQGNLVVKKPSLAGGAVQRADDTRGGVHLGRQGFEKGR
jgi:hypothetical protein